MTRVSPTVTWLDPLLALLLLLPAALLAFPATLAQQLEPELSATGWWVLLQIPAALVLLVRTPRPSIPLLTLFAIFVGFGLLSLWVLSPSDTLSASRALLCAIASLGALVAGSALGPQGRRVFVGGLVLISIGLCVPALGGASPRIQGALQNSGATSEAALLGALAALGALAGAHAGLRVILLSVLAGYAAFVALAPVFAGALVFALVALLAWIVRRADRGSLALGLCVFAVIAGALYPALRVQDSSPSGPAAAIAADQVPRPAGHLGGVGVRLSIWPRTLAMFGEHLALGVAPGQFRANFPAYRDAGERLRSDRAAGDGVESEVEHAHNDVLTTLAEIGVFGGLAWIAMQVSLAIAAWRALQHGDRARTALALAVLGLQANAWLRAPLTFNPASASLFFAAAGALIARDEATCAPGRMRRLLPLICLALLVLQAPRAWRFVQHGLALRAPDRIDLPKARAACPDSPLALSLTARRLEADPARLTDARMLWDQVLALRPLNFEARMQAGVLAARAGDVARAGSHWLRALDIEPRRSAVLKNLLLLEAGTGDDAAFLRASERASGQLADEWAIEAGANEMLEGDERAALRLWKFAECDWLDQAPQQLYDRSHATPGEQSTLNKAQEMLAHLRFGREHAAAADYRTAVRPRP